MKNNENHYANVAMNQSAIQRAISTRQSDQPPTTLREYLARMQMLPRLTGNRTAVNGFVAPVDLSASNLRLVTGLVNSRIQRTGFQSELDKPISVIREMLLFTYEATPRPISFALSGYTASDFLAYIYQDVLMNDMNMSAQDRQLPFVEIVNDIKGWMRVPPGPSVINTARRHIRRRIMALLDRSNHQAASLLEDREMPIEIVLLMQKLLERDDDQGYTNGDIRPFREVRHDFNLLAEYCIRQRYAPDSRQIEALEMVFCPSTVHDLSLYSIQKPRGRPPSSGKEKVGHHKKPQTTKKPSGNSAVRLIDNSAIPDIDEDFGLNELAKLV